MLNILKTIIIRYKKHKKILAHNKMIMEYSKEHNSYISYSCSINCKTIIEDNVILKCGSHNDSFVGRGTYTWSSTSGMKIGRYCSIGPGMVLVKRTHPIKIVSSWPGLYNSDNAWDGPRLNKSIFFDESLKVSDSDYLCIVGNDVWIGQNVTIKGGIRIGDGAVIGMGSVVVNDVPPYAVVGGNPAKIIKYRFDCEEIDFLLKIKWWNWDYETIKKYSDYFSSPVNLRNALKNSRKQHE